MVVCSAGMEEYASKPVEVSKRSGSASKVEEKLVATEPDLR